MGGLLEWVVKVSGLVPKEPIVSCQSVRSKLCLCLYLDGDVSVLAVGEVVLGEVRPREDERVVEDQRLEV